MNLTEAGRYFPDQRIGGANVWHILLDSSWLHEQAAVGLRCRRLLELLKPSDPVGHLLRPRDVLAHRPSAKSGAAKLVCPTCDCGAHQQAQQLVDPLDARVGTLAMRALTPPRVRLEPAAWRQSSLSWHTDLPMTEGVQREDSTP